MNNKHLLSTVLLFALSMLFFSCSNEDEPQENYVDIELVSEPYMGALFDGVEFPGSGCEFDMIVMSNCDWIMQERIGFTVTPEEGKSGETKVHARLAASTKSVSQERKIRIAYGNSGYSESMTFYATQRPAPLMTVTPNSLDFGVNGGERTISVFVNYLEVPEFEIPQDATWITIKRIDGGYVDDNYNITSKYQVKCSSNYSAIRTAQIKLKTQNSNFPNEKNEATLYITQEGR